MMVKSSVEIKNPKWFHRLQAIYRPMW